MLKGMTSLLTLVCIAFGGLADDKVSQKEAEIRMAIAMKKAKETRSIVTAKSRAIPFAEAAPIAMKANKPIFISVNADCTNLCSEIRPDFITCHEKEFAGSKESRYILAVPSNGKFINLEWKNRPRPEDIRAEARKWATPKKPGLSRLEDAGNLLAMITMGLMPAEAAEQVEYVQFGNTCPGGVCQNCTAPAGYAPMPAGGGPVTYVQGGSGDFVARHPRIARLRGRIRSALGLQPPQVAGYYQEAPQAAPQAEATPQAVGGPIRRLTNRAEVHFALAHVLRTQPLTADQKAAVDAVLNNGNLYELAVSTATHHLDKAAATGGPVGKLGDGTLFQKLLDNLPAILNDIITFLKALNVIH